MNQIIHAHLYYSGERCRVYGAKEVHYKSLEKVNAYLDELKKNPVPIEFAGDEEFCL